MSEIKWIKLSTATFDDEKIKLIEQMPDADTTLVIWLKLLTLAGKTNASGFLWLSREVPYTDENLATLFNRPLQVVRYALEIFRRFGMIEFDGDYISIANWEKHQNIDGMEKVREQTRQRNIEYRERKKLKTLEFSDAKRDVTMTHDDAIDIDKEKEINIPHEVTSDYEPEFETIWDKYPRKVDKKSAYKSFKVARKRHTLEAMLLGVENYAIECKKENREQKFIKHASTFFNGETFTEYQTKPAQPKPMPEMKPIGAEQNWGEDELWTNTKDSTTKKSSGSGLL